MRNKLIRHTLYIGFDGKLILDTLKLDIDFFNSNIEAYKVVRRYNSILQSRLNRELSRTHKVKASFDNLGNYSGYSWVRK